MIIWWMKNVKDIYSSAKNKTTYIGGFCAVFLFMIDARSFSDRRFVLKGVIHNQSLVFFTVVIFFIIQRIQSDKVKTLLSNFLKVRKLVSPIHNRSKNGDESDYSKKLIGWLRWGWFHERTAFLTAVYKSIIFNCNVRYQTDTRLLSQKSIATIQKLGFTRDSVTMMVYDRVVETKIMLWNNRRTKRLGLDQVSLAHQRHFIYCHNTDCILPYRKWQSRILIWF